MVKSRDAFRTISEVSEWLETPAHVLRFWESRFSQIKPVKRAGGRRYYRPADMRLLGGIKRLLHDDGITIKGVQKILREKGVKYVASLCLESLDGEAGAAREAEKAAPERTPIEEIETAAQAEPAAELEPAPEAEPTPEPEPEPEPIRFDTSALGEAPITVDEIDEEAQEARIVALYQRLQALRDRMRAAMDAP